jgi:nitrate reductase gamma subunit
MINYYSLCKLNKTDMDGRTIFHCVVFILLGIYALWNARGEKSKRKYLSLASGILALLIAIYDILVIGCGVTIF